ncbi:hypothetical protein MANES_03G069664v8 [Manihot esculenta]|uniref:Uncharacterized protein n=1 Tax=Manihot esculenta TaxID=3983 RepID=A0ACB7HZB9_MANES|nr:hypothetical protein MANES_03G069664v8 [Manihot esculenta]
MIWSSCSFNHSITNNERKSEKMLFFFLAGFGSHSCN